MIADAPGPVGAANATDFSPSAPALNSAPAVESDTVSTVVASSPFAPSVATLPANGVVIASSSDDPGAVTVLPLGVSSLTFTVSDAVVWSLSPSVTVRPNRIGRFSSVCAAPLPGVGDTSEADCVNV